MKKLLIILLVLVNFGSTIIAQTFMLSSNPLKKSEMQLYDASQYYEITKQYDWKTEEWKSLAEDKRQSFIKTLPMVGFGVTDKLALYAQMPASYYTENGENYLYFEDMLLMTRYAIIPSSKSKSGITLIGAVRLPTGKTGSNKQYSDGSYDYILGGIYSSKFYGKWRTHFKTDYTFNTEGTNLEKAGNEFNLLWKQDYSLGFGKIAIINQYYNQAKKQDKDEVIVNNTQKSRITHTLEFEYKFKNGLFARPKILIPSYSEGGQNFTYKFILELNYSIQFGQKKV